jgi:hypothetical protein
MTVRVPSPNINSSKCCGILFWVGKGVLCVLHLLNYPVFIIRYLVFICFNIRKIDPNNKRRKQHDFFPSKVMRGFVCKHARGYGYHITTKLAVQDSLYY